MAHKFVDLTKDGKKVYLYEYNANTDTLKTKRQVLWGDWLQIDENHVFPPSITNHLAVNWAPNSPNAMTLYIKEEHTTDERPLEIIFLDVGQGDGAVLITPEPRETERVIVIDAGEGEHMHNFLKGRFEQYRDKDFDFAVLTHPDKDHYLGFKSIFADHEIGFKTVYQNGLVERPVGSGYDKLGGLTPDGSLFYMEDLATSRNDIETHFASNANFGSKVFPPVMHNALNNPNISEFKMLSTHINHSTQENSRKYMPGFAPSDGRSYSIEVLGPVAESNNNGDPRLRRISSNYNKTKNGHSVILRLHFGKFKILFGGDLNTPAEKFLLQHYTNRDSFPRKTNPDNQLMIQEARHWFGADIMKVCHHGAADVTDEFLQTVNPGCFVISSGDHEGHVHPRPDLLGRLGKFGRGESPVLLSTELQRSTREKEDEDIVAQLRRDIVKVQTSATQTRKDRIEKNIQKLAKNNVDVYGSIYVKTDGNRLITAFKFEEKSDKKKWFYFEYSIDNSGELHLTS